MKSFFVPFLISVSIACASDRKPLADSASSDKSLNHSFSLLPRAFQKNPELEITGFTFLTDDGRKLSPPSVDSPIYYKIHDQGLQMRGESTGYNDIPSAAELDDTLQRTLASAGYLPAEGKHEPELLLVYFRGAHNRLDRDTADQFPDLARQYAMERAQLVGGKDYALKLARELDRPSLNIDVSFRHEFLKEQALNDLYYIVISAYNYHDATHNQHRLLWRTTMTVNSRGISMNQGMPALIVMGEKFYGRETTEPMVIQRDFHSGNVKLGPLKVIEQGLSVHAPATANK